MEKAFILFCVCRSVSCREHAVELHGNQGGIDHGIFAAARMHGEAFDLYLGAYRVEILVLDFIFCAAVYGVGKISSEALSSAPRRVVPSVVIRVLPFRSARCGKSLRVRVYSLSPSFTSVPS